MAKVLPPHVNQMLAPGAIAVLAGVETIIGRVKNITETHVELHKPHVVVAQPGRTGIAINFVPYGGLNLLPQRESRWFPLAHFMQVDMAEENAGKQFSAAISGIVAPGGAFPQL